MKDQFLGLVLIVFERNLERKVPHDEAKAAEDVAEQRKESIAAMPRSASSMFSFGQSE